MRIDNNVTTKRDRETLQSNIKTMFYQYDSILKTNIFWSPCYKKIQKTMNKKSNYQGEKYTL